MNFLAHIFLTKHHEEWMIGNFIADFVKNKDLESLPPNIQDGVQLHRKIDMFTDEHSMVLESNKLLYKRHHKYAGVLTDVFYDYLLYQDWKRYTQQDFILFKEQTYSILTKHIAAIPSHLQARTLNMITHDWLQSYTSEKGMNYTFERMKTRASKPELFDDAFQSLSEHIDLFQAHFRDFFPDLINFVDNYTPK